MKTSAGQENPPTPAHIAHLHLLSVINTELFRIPPGDSVRILDAGCGAGRLVVFLADMLPRLRPGLTYEFYGFDVTDRPSENFGEEVQELVRRVPGTPWEERLIRIPAETSWPYPDDFFDIVISNQVGEHLRDHSHFFGEIGRCLSPRGFSVNLFPLKHVILEWHVLIPFAHRIKNYDLLKVFIGIASRVRSLASRKSDEAGTRAARAASEAAFVIKYTGYISYGDLLSATKRYGLLMSTRYTKEFYVQKVRQMLSRPPLYEYSRQRSIAGDWLLVFLLRYVQGVTVFLEKGNI
jgi:SAM-dependent methyltransferase